MRAEAGSESEVNPLTAALERVGDRWTLLLVQALLRGPRRFGDLEREIQGIAPNILTKRLQHLGREGLVLAIPYTQRPLRVDYRLTGTGQELAGALRLLAHWGARHSEADPPRHDACGTPLEPRWHCPTCERQVADDEEAIRFL